jgi:zinc transport system ATP-binding protein
MTIIMVTHDIQAAIKYASHILYVGSEPLFNSRDVFLHSSPGKRFSFGTVVQEEIHD